jgi:hypothetical protein
MGSAYYRDPHSCFRCSGYVRLVGLEQDPARKSHCIRSFECSICGDLTTDSVRQEDVDGHGKRITSFAQGGFDEDAIRIWSIAFEAAWQVIESSGSAVNKDVARILLAKCITEHGSDGVNDATRLGELALATMVKSGAVRLASAD